MRYYDRNSVLQVLGAIYNNSNVLERQEIVEFPLSPNDFSDSFHRLIYFTLQNLYNLGQKDFNPIAVENYLRDRQSSYALFQKHKGAEFLERISQIEDEGFIRHYNRLKKMTLLRTLENHGVDVRFIYDWDSMDPVLKGNQLDWVDSNEIVAIANRIDEMIEDIKQETLGSALGSGSHVSEGLSDLVARLKESPEYGAPFYGSILNSVTRGARLQKYYLFSAGTGRGKSRFMLGQTCHSALSKMCVDGKWEDLFKPQNSLFITTELDIEEVQTMTLAFTSGVNEDKILNGTYNQFEEKIMNEAIQELEKAPLWIEHIPDFSLRDIESIIRRNVRENGITYCSFDYIHSSLKILEEISTRTKGMKLREDNVLFMLSARLKDLANELGIFIMSGTQLTSDFGEAETPDQSLLRGARSIADRIDVGMIGMFPSEKDKQAMEAYSDYGTPNYYISIYKNRRGKISYARIWCEADLGTCRIKPLFVTDHQYQPIDVDAVKIEMKPVQKQERKPASAF